MSKTAVRHVQQHFAIEVVADQYIDLLYEIILGSAEEGAGYD